MSDDSNQKPDLSALKIKRDDYRESVSTGKYLRLSLWIIIPLLILAVVWVILSRISPSVEVRIAAAVQLTESQSHSVLSATGYVVAQRQAAVASKGTGRLEFLGVEEGDVVKEGQLIGRLENEDMQAVLDMAKANLAQAHAESTYAANSFKRYCKWLNSGATTRAQFDESEAKYLSACAVVQSMRASIRSAKVALENTFIRAPFDGTVLMKYADVGEVVAPFASSASSRGAVVDLADMNSLEVEADVSESNIQKVLAGQPCEIILDAYPDIRYKGVVKKIVPTADRSRATVLTKVSFLKKDGRVLPEMSARVNFFSEDNDTTTVTSKTSVSVPNSALVMRGSEQALFTIIDDRVKQIDVTVGKNFGSQVEIIRGVRPNQKVIISPPSDLKTGDKIKVIN
ncbi:MAG: efflux RND transporter periplasmic adaptor subunit [candidate division Zixibacteria bacterium]|nr:efflux RND transporter periplasmic adaptor subunit [candidate division Zixibacteria bacterium]